MRTRLRPLPEPAADPRASAPRPLRGGRGGALAARLRRFARDESGLVSVESVLWLPFFFSFLMLVTDVSLAFYGKAQAFRLIQDTNRALSVGRLATSGAARTALQNAMNSYVRGATVQVTLSRGNSTVSTRVTIPIRSLVLFTTLGGLMDGTIEVGAAGLLEVIPAS